MEDQSGGDSFAGKLSSEVHHDRACSWDRVIVADLVEDVEESVASVALLCENAAVMSRRGSWCGDSSRQSRRGGRCDGHRGGVGPLAADVRQNRSERIKGGCRGEREPGA